MRASSSTSARGCRRRFDRPRPELTKALRVGPQSAGADPGPAAYGKGGTEPTVTDANIVLGYLPKCEARLRHVLNRELALTAVKRWPTR